MDDAGIEDVIPLPQVKKETLEKVLEYCKHITKIDAPVIEKPLLEKKIPVD